MKIFLFISVLAVALTRINVTNEVNADAICGKWASSEKNLVVQVYKDGNEFKAKIIWFKGLPGKPMDDWYDTKNPDPSLRNRKLLGMNVLRALKFDYKNNSWEDGVIYDSLHGHEWDASAYIDAEGLLKVKGYWHFKFIGRTLTFKRD